MAPDAVLINQPMIDFATFIGLAHKALGYSPAKSADSARRPMGDAEKFLWCLAGLNTDSPSGILPHLLGHVSFSVFICADERDLIDIMECASGMHFVPADSLVSGVKVAVISGTLSQWRDSIKSATTPDEFPMVRLCFSKILSQFDKAGLTAVWNECSRKTAPDQTGLYLEDKRR